MTAKKSNSLEAKLMRAKTFLQTWELVDPTLAVDKLTLAAYTIQVDDLETSFMEMMAHEVKAEETRTVIEAKVEKTDLGETQIRNFAKIRFGSNSLQYGQLGGVRTSERKRPNRRSRKNPPTASAALGASTPETPPSE